MSDIITNEWAPPAPPALEPPRRRPKIAFILVVVSLVLAVAGVAVYAFMVHGDLTDARGTITHVTDERDRAQASLKHTQGVLADTRSDLGGVKAHLANCQPLGAASRHLMASAGQLSRALQATLSDNFFTEMDALDQATNDLDAANRVATNHGFGALQNMIDACDFSTSLGT
jgi:hypothetical protein